MIRLIPLLVGSLILATTDAQTTYYVSKADGNDADDGLTEATAWKTIQKSFDSVAAGDTVLIKAGSYFENPVMHVSGSPGQPISFRNFPGDNPAIDGSPGSPVVTIEDQSHVELHGIRIQGITANGAQGLLIRATPNGGVQDVRIVLCPIRYFGWTLDPLAVPADTNNAQPLIVYGEGLTQANAISGLVLDSLNVFDNITGYSETISIDGNVDGFLVRQCDVHDNTNIGIHAAGHYGVSQSALLDNARNGIIADCRTWNNLASYATSGGIYVDGGDNILIERCKSFSNGYGIEVGCERDGEAQGIIVRDNLIMQNHEAGLAIGGYDSLTTGQVLDTEVRNNSLFQNDQDGSGSGEVYITKASGLSFTNNLVSSTGQNILLSREAITPQANNSFDFNAWSVPTYDPSVAEVNWGTITLAGYADYLSTTGWDGNGIFADPLVTDAYAVDPDVSLQAGSPCIDAGDPATLIPLDETDFIGAQRITGAHVDIGAYEWYLTDAIGEGMVQEMTVMPNPAEDFVMLGDVPSLTIIELFDVHGWSVRTWKHQQRSLDLRGIPPGLYLISALTANGDHRVARLVKR